MLKSFIAEYQNQCPGINAWIKSSYKIHIISYEKNKKDILFPLLKIIKVELHNPSINFRKVNRTISDFELLVFLAISYIEAYQDDIKWVLFSRIMDKNKSAISRPDPDLAPLAEQKREDFFQAIAPYISREEVIVEHPPLTDRDIKFYEDLETFLSILERYKDD